MSNLLELAERVEKAEGPDRWIDAEIAVAMNARPDWLLGDTRALVICAHGRVSAGKYGPGFDALEYSASLDAALTLVGPDDSWTLSRLGDGMFWCSVCFPDDEADNFTCTGKTPALAMVPAALRARAAMETTR